MSATWTVGKIHYLVQCVGPYGVELIIPIGAQSEADIDTGIEAFISAYNALHPVSAVSKSYDGTATTDWSYTP